MISENEIDVYHQLGKRIAYLRKQKKMSCLELSLEANINRNYLNDLENGKRNPTLRILRQIAIALDIDLSDLFVGIRDYSLKNDRKVNL